MYYVLNPYCLPVPWHVSNRIRNENEIITSGEEIQSHSLSFSGNLQHLFSETTLNRICLRRIPLFSQSVIPALSRMNASSNAVSRRASKRPVAPPCPDSMLVFRSRILSSVFSVLSLAAYFAGS